LIQCCLMWFLWAISDHNLWMIKVNKDTFLVADW
jgi:hypothetical protein